ncbi:hypothetical protein [Blastococcus sp. SYSU D00820]
MWFAGSGEDDEFQRRMSPPENELPVALPAPLLLARTPDAAVALTALRVHTTGVSMEFAVRVRPGALPEQELHRLLWQHGPGVPAFLLGVELADGTRVDNARQAAADVVFTQGSGSGGEFSLDQTWWLSPLPPAGPLRFVVRCPALGIDETVAELDGTAIARAVEDVVVLWPWSPPRRPDAGPPPPPDLPGDSWFAGR